MDQLRRPLLHLQILIGLAVLLGGGGVSYALLNLIVQLAALLILALHPSCVVQFLREGPAALKILIAATLLLPLLQLVPLPPAIWQSLPGRDLVMQSYSTAGIPRDSWMPFTLDPGRTLVAAAGLIAPVTIAMIGFALRSKDRIRLCWTLIAAALLVFLLGAIQLLTTNQIGYFFNYDRAPDVLYGTFANRNTLALFFCMALVLLVVAPALGRFTGMPLVRTGLGALLALGVLLTQSRTGMVLLAVALVFTALRVVAAFALRSGNRGGERESTATNDPLLLGAVVFGVVIAGAVVFSLQSGGRASESLERFSAIETDRFEMWEDARFAADRYWPSGAGVGTFDEVFQIDESLEYVSIRRAGRAHNDYLDLAIETGIVGFGLTLLWVAWIIFASLRGWGWRTGEWLAPGAGLALGLVAAQSLLDYPLRNQTLLCAVAVFLALLAHSAKGKRA